MTYQLVYSSEATVPMQSDDLDELLSRARRRNGDQGITGALMYADGMFLQVLEGDRTRLADLMAKIRKDLRHENVTVLREGEIPAAVFGGWKMAYVPATPEQVASWAGLAGVRTATAGPEEPGDERERTARFAQDILALLEPARPAGTTAD